MVKKPVADESYLSDEYLVIITSSYHKEIEKQLSGMAYENVMCFPFIKDRHSLYDACLLKNIRDLANQNNWDDEREEKYAQECFEKNDGEQFVIPYLPVMITTRCTLKCEYCNNLMPYFKEKACDSLAEKIMENVEKVTNVAGKILFLEIVGGEPLLHKNLEQILQGIADNDKVEKIVIVTNGTVIPNEAVTNLLKKYNVLIRVSDYGYLERIVRFVRYAEENELNIWVTASDWMYPGNLEKREASTYELCKQVEACFFTMQCKYMYEGKIFHCARAASLYALGYLGEEEGLDVQNLTEKKLRDFYLKTYYSGACKYCYLFTDKTKTISPGKQMYKEEFQSEYTVIKREEWIKYQQMKEDKLYRGE